MTTCRVCYKVVPFALQGNTIPLCSESCVRRHIDSENRKYHDEHSPSEFLVTHEPFTTRTYASVPQGNQGLKRANRGNLRQTSPYP